MERIYFIMVKGVFVLMVLCVFLAGCATKDAVAEEDSSQLSNAAETESEKVLPPFPTCKDIDSCVCLGILENSAFVEACGIVVPEIEKEMRSAFNEWSVLKLPIPGIQKSLSPDNPDRAYLLAHILPYLKRIPSHEVSIECEGRFAMMKDPVPTLLSDAASLPEGVLSRYQK